MKQYNRLALGILVILAVTLVAGCRSVANYQNSIFDDDSKIAKQVDSYTYLTQTGKRIENETNIKFTSFSGMDTIYKIKSDGENDVELAFESIIEDGEFKVVVIAPDDGVIDIVEGTKEGKETILAKDGVSRVKLVGRKAKGQIKIKIGSEDGVDVRQVD